MLCQNCGKNEANVKYTQIVNGVKKEMVLCEDCASKLGIDNFKINMPIHFSNFLDDFFTDEQLLPSFVREKHSQCNNCGELYDDFIKTGLLGCPSDYDMFGDRLERVLRNIQGGTKHIGRKPLNIDEKLSNIGENKKPEKKMSETEKLTQELNQAIKEERYEDAAKLRDEIKKLNERK